MEILMRPDGRRDRSYRPYINMEEYEYHFGLYDPNSFTGPQFGLYDGAQPMLLDWPDYSYRQINNNAERKIVPGSYVNDGRNIPIQGNCNHAPQFFQNGRYIYKKPICRQCR